MISQEKLLRAAFLVGAITDLLAVLPMIVPPVAKILWGFGFPDLTSLPWVTALPLCSDGQHC